MQLREAILRETLNGLRDRAARYRRVSSLLGGRPKDSRLTALAREIEEWADQIERTMEKVHTQVAATHVLVAEIDACIGRAGQEVAFSKMRRNGRYSADDLREEARLCAEEARAASDLAEKRKLAATAADLADAAESVERVEATPEV
ncbi:MAG TPA: hypothetical protein VGP50_02725 [Stellaceae bacterium]|jgi:hypothetical protein|nr:hypothetical protein [Stellaceae bacterium]